MRVESTGRGQIDHGVNPTGSKHGQQQKKHYLWTQIHKDSILLSSLVMS